MAIFKRRDELGNNPDAPTYTFIKPGEDANMDLMSNASNALEDLYGDSSQEVRDNGLSEGFFKYQDPFLTPEDRAKFTPRLRVDLDRDELMEANQGKNLSKYYTMGDVSDREYNSAIRTAADNGFRAAGIADFYIDAVDNGEPDFLDGVGRFVFDLFGDRGDYRADNMPGGFLFTSSRDDVLDQQAMGLLDDNDPYKNSFLGGAIPTNGIAPWLGGSSELAGDVSEVLNTEDSQFNPRQYYNKLIKQNPMMKVYFEQNGLTASDFDDVKNKRAFDYGLIKRQLRDARDRRIEKVDSERSTVEAINNTLLSVTFNYVLDDPDTLPTLGLGTGVKYIGKGVSAGARGALSLVNQADKAKELQLALKAGNLPSDISGMNSLLFATASKAKRVAQFADVNSYLISRFGAKGVLPAAGLLSIQGAGSSWGDMQKFAEVATLAGGTEEEREVSWGQILVDGAAAGIFGGILSGAAGYKSFFKDAEAYQNVRRLRKAEKADARRRAAEIGIEDTAVTHADPTRALGVADGHRSARQVAAKTLSDIDPDFRPRNETEVAEMLESTIGTPRQAFGDGTSMLHIGNIFGRLRSRVTMGALNIRNFMQDVRARSLAVREKNEVSFGSDFDRAQDTFIEAFENASADNLSRSARGERMLNVDELSELAANRVKEVHGKDWQYAKNLTNDELGELVKKHTKSADEIKADAARRAETDSAEFTGPREQAVRDRMVIDSVEGAHAIARRTNWLGRLYSGSMPSFVKRFVTGLSNFTRGQTNMKQVRNNLSSVVRSVASLVDPSGRIRMASLRADGSVDVNKNWYQLHDEANVASLRLVTRVQELYRSLGRETGNAQQLLKYEVETRVKGEELDPTRVAEIMGVNPNNSKARAALDMLKDIRKQSVSLNRTVLTTQLNAGQLRVDEVQRYFKPINDTEGRWTGEIERDPLTYEPLIDETTVSQYQPVQVDMNKIEASDQAAITQTFIKAYREDLLRRVVKDYDELPRIGDEIDYEAITPGMLRDDADIDYLLAESIGLGRSREGTRLHDPNNPEAGTELDTFGFASKSDEVAEVAVELSDNNAASSALNVDQVDALRVSGVSHAQRSAAESELAMVRRLQEEGLPVESMRLNGDLDEYLQNRIKMEQASDMNLAAINNRIEERARTSNLTTSESTYATIKIVSNAGEYYVTVRIPRTLGDLTPLNRSRYLAAVSGQDTFSFSGGLRVAEGQGIGTLATRLLEIKELIRKIDGSDNSLDLVSLRNRLGFLHENLKREVDVRASGENMKTVREDVIEISGIVNSINAARRASDMFRLTEAQRKIVDDLGQITNRPSIITLKKQQKLSEAKAELNRLKSQRDSLTDPADIQKLDDQISTQETRVKLAEDSLKGDFPDPDFDDLIDGINKWDVNVTDEMVYLQNRIERIQVEQEARSKDLLDKLKARAKTTEGTPESRQLDKEIDELQEEFRRASDDMIDLQATLAARMDDKFVFQAGMQTEVIAQDMLGRVDEPRVYDIDNTKAAQDVRKLIDSGQMDEQAGNMLLVALSTLNPEMIKNLNIRMMSKPMALKNMRTMGQYDTDLHEIMINPSRVASTNREGLTVTLHEVMHAVTNIHFMEGTSLASEAKALHEILLKNGSLKPMLREMLKEMEPDISNVLLDDFVDYLSKSPQEMLSQVGAYMMTRDASRVIAAGIGAVGDQAASAYTYLRSVQAVSSFIASLYRAVARVFKYKGQDNAAKAAMQLADDFFSFNGKKHQELLEGFITSRNDPATTAEVMTRGNRIADAANETLGQVNIGTFGIKTTTPQVTEKLGDFLDNIGVSPAVREAFMDVPRAASNDLQTLMTYQLVTRNLMPGGRFDGLLVSDLSVNREMSPETVVAAVEAMFGPMPKFAQVAADIKTAGNSLEEARGLFDFYNEADSLLGRFFESMETNLYDFVNKTGNGVPFAKAREENIVHALANLIDSKVNSYIKLLNGRNPEINAAMGQITRILQDSFDADTAGSIAATMEQILARGRGVGEMLERAVKAAPEEAVQIMDTRMTERLIGTVDVQRKLGRLFDDSVEVRFNEQMEGLDDGTLRLESPLDRAAIANEINNIVREASKMPEGVQKNQMMLQARKLNDLINQDGMYVKGDGGVQRLAQQDAELVNQLGELADVSVRESGFERRSRSSKQSVDPAEMQIRDWMDYKQGRGRYSDRGKDGENAIGMVSLERAMRAQRGPSNPFRRSQSLFENQDTAKYLQLDHSIAYGNFVRHALFKAKVQEQIMREYNNADAQIGRSGDETKSAVINPHLRYSNQGSAPMDVFAYLEMIRKRALDQIADLSDEELILEARRDLVGHNRRVEDLLIKAQKRNDQGLANEARDILKQEIGVGFDRIANDYMKLSGDNRRFDRHNTYGLNAVRGAKYAMQVPLQMGYGYSALVESINGMSDLIATLDPKFIIKTVRGMLGVLRQGGRAAAEGLKFDMDRLTTATGSRFEGAVSGMGDVDSYASRGGFIDEFGGGIIAKALHLFGGEEIVPSMRKANAQRKVDGENFFIRTLGSAADIAGAIGSLNRVTTMSRYIQTQVAKRHIARNMKGWLKLQADMDTKVVTSKDAPKAIKIMEGAGTATPEGGWTMRSLLTALDDIANSKDISQTDAIKVEDATLAIWQHAARSSGMSLAGGVASRNAYDLAMMFVDSGMGNIRTQNGMKFIFENIPGLRDALTDGRKGPMNFTFDEIQNLITDPNIINKARAEGVSERALLDAFSSMEEMTVRYIVNEKVVELRGLSSADDLVSRTPMGELREMLMSFARAFQDQRILNAGGMTMRRFVVGGILSAILLDQVNQSSRRMSSGETTMEDELEAFTRMFDPAAENRVEGIATMLLNSFNRLPVLGAYSAFQSFLATGANSAFNAFDEATFESGVFAGKTAPVTYGTPAAGIWESVMGPIVRKVSQGNFLGETTSSGRYSPGALQQTFESFIGKPFFKKNIFGAQVGKIIEAATEEDDFVRTALEATGRRDRQDSAKVRIFEPTNGSMRYQQDVHQARTSELRRQRDQDIIEEQAKSVQSAADAASVPVPEIGTGAPASVPASDVSTKPGLSPGSASEPLADLLDDQ